MSNFDNDHLKINYLIIEFEKNINIILNVNQNLSSIQSLEEFSKAKSQMSNSLNNILKNITVLITALKLIQYNNRKLYDDYIIIQNNYEQVTNKANNYFSDNLFLLSDNKKLYDKVIEQEKIITKLNGVTTLNKMFEYSKIQKKKENENIKNNCIINLKKYNHCNNTIQNYIFNKNFDIEDNHKIPSKDNSKYEDSKIFYNSNKKNNNLNINKTSTINEQNTSIYNLISSPSTLSFNKYLSHNSSKTKFEHYKRNIRKKKVQKSNLFPFKGGESHGNLTNYFLFNLRREKVINNQVSKSRKKYKCLNLKL